MKFTPNTTRRVQFGFGPGGVGSEDYKKTVGHYHTGLDWFNGYGTPVIAENYGIVYKINTPDQSESGWCGVYTLVPDDKYGWIEETFGHLSRVDVKLGDVIREGQQVGLEGNKGEVYYNGTRITKAMQQKGDKRGSHVHYQTRPVTRVKKPRAGKHYLNGVSKHGYTDSLGRYRDKQGMYYEITLNNETKGCVDPHEFVGQKNSLKAYVVNAILSRLKITKV
jgi:murein DD-endopeptidase MepM/ murein hydrolase activator NlpD